MKRGVREEEEQRWSRNGNKGGIGRGARVEQEWKQGWKEKRSKDGAGR